MACRSTSCSTRTREAIPRSTRLVRAGGGSNTVSVGAPMTPRTSIHSRSLAAATCGMAVRRALLERGDLAGPDHPARCPLLDHRRVEAAGLRVQLPERRSRPSVAPARRETETAYDAVIQSGRPAARRLRGPNFAGRIVADHVGDRRSGRSGRLSCSRWPAGGPAFERPELDAPRSDSKRSSARTSPASPSRRRRHLLPLMRAHEGIDALGHHSHAAEQLGARRRRLDAVRLA